ncbi:unnamed protein product [Larinioides sclopetarius]|uniref:SHSP domain-containing protein n=1 Tax=Larinioides sclopetarius TaxID=280406 RepID=A0AAV1ZGW4_9ARAC
MGSLKRDDRIKECTRNFMESKSSKGSILTRKPELQDVELANKQLKYQLAEMDKMLLNHLKRLGANDRDICRHTGLAEIDPTPVNDAMFKERFKFMILTLEKLKNERLKVDKAIPYQLHAKIPRDHAQLEEHFISLNHILTKDIPEDFKIFIDCKQFKSYELKVIVKGGYILVQGSHDLKFDKHGWIKREFTRRWPIPENVEQDEFSCLLDRYGILTIRAPRKVSSIPIPIQTEKW